MKMISLRGITKTYFPGGGGEPVHALRGIDLEVEEGTIFTLIGPNGAGKTTLISVMTTLLFPDQGAGDICGFDLRRQSGKIREVVNLTSGNANFTDIFSVAENLNYYGMLYGMAGPKRRARIEVLIEMFQLHAHRNTPFNRLSTGTKQRLALAKSLLNEPRVLFLDEPTVGLDPQICQTIRASLKEMNRKMGLTIVLTTHNMDEAESLSDHISFLKGGRIVAQGNAKDLKSKVRWGDVIRIRYDGPSQDRCGLTSMAGTLEVHVTDDLITLTVDDHKKRLDTVIRTLVSGGDVLLRDIEILKPDLEDVFLELSKAPHSA